MKDAKGHGSDPRGGAAHQTGVSQIGQPIPISPKAIQIIKANAASGFSVTPGGLVPKTGFQVAVRGRTDEQPLDMKNLAASIAAHVQANRDVYSSPNTYIGGWKSPYDGRVHLEPSRNIQPRDVAEHLGVFRNQVSIWDDKNAREIMTGGTGR